MKVPIKEYRVHEDEDVDLKKRPTIVDPVYGSESRYEEMLAKHVEKLSALQQLHYASNRHAVLLIFPAIDAAGKDGAPARDVRREPARMPGLQLQASQCKRTGARLPLANDAGSAGARPDRHFQRVLL